MQLNSAVWLMYKTLKLQNYVPKHDCCLFDVLFMFVDKFWKKVTL